MKNPILSLTGLILICWLATAGLQAQDLPKPSPKATIEQQVGLTDLSIVYSRPGVKERTIWGDLVPYDKVWRTGANKATAFSTSTDIKINGQELKAGDYSLFTIPSESGEWTVIFNNETELWGAGEYKEEDDALRFKTKITKGEHVESLRFCIDDVNNNSATVELAWEAMRLSFNIEADPAATAQANIEKAIEKAENSFRTYNNAATYYLDTEKDPKQALAWAEKSCSMDERFWNVYQLSRAQAANGMYKEAIKTAEKSMKMAEEAKYEPYIKRNKVNIEKWTAMK